MVLEGPEGKGNNGHMAPRTHGGVGGRSRLLAAGALALLIGASACSSEEEVVRSPVNVLLLVADDLGVHDLGSYHNRFCTTPNLNRLQRAGCRFDSAYVPSAVCQPSRSALYTGLYPHRNGATGFGPIREDVPTWPELFAEAGVATAQIGKLNVEPVERFPFEFMVRAGPDFADGRDPLLYEEAFSRFLETLDGRRFCAVVNFKDPHRPFPTRDVEEGRAAEVSDPHDPAEVQVHPFLHDTPETRVELAAYYDAIRRLDEGCGRVLDVLEREGLAQDTVVIFVSDNGMPFPFAKTTLYEAGTRVPMFMRWPGVIPPDKVDRALVSLVDILPTALHLMGVEVPAGLDGQVLAMAGGQEPAREAVFGSHDEHLVGAPHPSRSIRVRGWRYILNFSAEEPFENNAMATETWRSWERAAESDAELAERLRRLRHRPLEELYRLTHDRWELENVAEQEEHADVRDILRTRLREWMEECGDPMLEEWPF